MMRSYVAGRQALSNDELFLRSVMTQSQTMTTGKSKTVVKKITTRGARRAVLHLCPDLEPDGPARETVDLAVLSQRSGQRALIASSGGRLVTEAERSAVKHTRMPLHGRGMFVNWRNRVHLAALTQRERLSLIHAHSIDMVPMALSLNRSHHLPIALDVTEPLPNTQRTQNFFASLMQVSSLIRVPSEYMMIQLLETFHLPSQRIRLVPPGVDTQWYSTGSIGADRLQSLSRLWRLPEQATMVLVPMPLQPGFGHEVFLDALASIKDENIYAILIGSDRYIPGHRTALETKINKLELNGKVVMPEYCSDWPTAFWLAGIVVAPNIAPRGQNRKLLAAQAIGRPVIVTDSGANNEMVQSGSTAWVVPPDDAPALAAALREAIRLNTDQRLNLAQQTRDFVMEHFPQDRWFKGMMELYEVLTSPASQKLISAEAA